MIVLQTILADFLLIAHTTQLVKYPRVSSVLSGYPDHLKIISKKVFITCARYDVNVCHTFPDQNYAIGFIDKCDTQETILTYQVPHPDARYNRDLWNGLTNQKWLPTPLTTGKYSSITFI